MTGAWTAVEPGRRPHPCLLGGRPQVVAGLGLQVERERFAAGRGELGNYCNYRGVLSYYHEHARLRASASKTACQTSPGFTPEIFRLQSRADRGLLMGRAHDCLLAAVAAALSGHSYRTWLWLAWGQA